MKNVAYAMCCDYCVMSDVENDAMRCDGQMWWCDAMWNMWWCEICCDVECEWGVELVGVGWCEMWTVAV